MLRIHVTPAHNQALHPTPEASAFFSFAISEQNFAFAKSSLASGAGEQYVICEERNMHSCAIYICESANIGDTKRSSPSCCFFATGAESVIASSHSVADVTVPTFMFVNELNSVLLR